jgi:hypothetical protein
MLNSRTSLWGIATLALASSACTTNTSLGNNPVGTGGALGAPNGATSALGTGGAVGSGGPSVGGKEQGGGGTTSGLGGSTSSDGGGGTGGAADAGGVSRDAVSDAQAAESSDHPPYVNACQAVANSTFLSTEEHECGLSSTGGVSMCHWSLFFTDDGSTRTVTCRLSDYLLMMSYQCAGFTLTGTMSGGLTYTGTYDPSTGILHWDQYDYSKSSS